MNTHEHQQPRHAIPCTVEVRTEDGGFHRFHGLFPSTCAALDHALERFGAWAKIGVTPIGYAEVRQ
jgi:hypothetical protein